MLVQYKISEYESLYTLAETEKIIGYNRSKAKRKAERAYYIKQKVSGLILLFIGIITPFLLDGDATFSLVSVPLGMFLILTRQTVMLFEDKNTVN